MSSKKTKSKKTNQDNVKTERYHNDFVIFEYFIYISIVVISCFCISSNIDNIDFNKIYNIRTSKRAIISNILEVKNNYPNMYNIINTYCQPLLIPIFILIYLYIQLTIFINNIFNIRNVIKFIVWNISFISVSFFFISKLKVAFKNSLGGLAFKLLVAMLLYIILLNEPFFDFSFVTIELFTEIFFNFNKNIAHIKLLQFLISLTSIYLFVFVIYEYTSFLR
jgi:hypothetical protein